MTYKTHHNLSWVIYAVILLILIVAIPGAIILEKYKWYLYLFLIPVYIFFRDFILPTCNKKNAVAKWSAPPTGNFLHFLVMVHIM